MPKKTPITRVDNIDSQRADFCNRLIARLHGASHGRHSVRCVAPMPAEQASVQASPWQLGGRFEGAQWHVQLVSPLAAIEALIAPLALKQIPRAAQELLIEAVFGDMFATLTIDTIGEKLDKEPRRSLVAMGLEVLEGETCVSTLTLSVEPTLDIEGFFSFLGKPRPLIPRHVSFALDLIAARFSVKAELLPTLGVGDVLLIPSQCEFQRDVTLVPPSPKS